MDRAQVVSNAQNAEMNIFHAFPVLAIHMALSVLTKRCRLVRPNQDRIPERWGGRFPVCMSFGN
jgi:hypothetical protein